MGETTTSVFKVHINGSINDVWNAMTRTDKLNPVFFNMRMDVDQFEPGGKLRMRTAGDKYTGAVGEILECNPPHRLVHTFRFTQYDDPPCTMTYELTEAPNGGVDFVLTASDIPVGTKSAGQLGGGGKLIALALKSMVERGKPTFTMWMIGMVSKIAPVPKKCLSQNWP
ncbi:MAG: SRPBCC domain-containing protein [Phycisphaerae bacterium]